MSGSSLTCIDVSPGSRSPAATTALSIVVPCHNEAPALDRLALELGRLERALAGRYEIELVLVDDGSTDATWALLRELFSGQAGVQLLRHETNRGIAAAIGTGIGAATAEIVA